MKLFYWYDACRKAASIIRDTVPEPYRSRTFPGIIGDIKALPPAKARSLFMRKKGLGRQYAYLYLSSGIDDGRGYQACATEALDAVLGPDRDAIIRGAILDVGCAVGVTAGILELDRVTGFDLFPDLLKTARLVDSMTGREHRYVAADMTRDWPFGCEFETVVCGLVCHHLKEQPDVTAFFSSLNSVLHPGGYAIITLPAGSVASAARFENLAFALENFGFSADRTRSGLVLSIDDPRSLFWMFLLVARKTSPVRSPVFIDPGFGFHRYRTSEKREEKGEKARATVAADRRVKHEAFRLVPLDEMAERYGDRELVFSTLTAVDN